MTESSDAAGEVLALRRLVAELQERLDRLEAQVGTQPPQLSEETVLAISAAVAAYLGKRARIRQIHLQRGGGWVSQGRTAGQLIHADPRGSR